MTYKNTEGDNWGQLLSDFGIEDKVQEDVAQSGTPKTSESVEAPECSAQYQKTSSKPTGSDDFGTGLTDSEMETADEPSTSKEKKSIFSRFPKINFFGVPPQVSLDSVIEGGRSSSLGGKTFTDNKLEKMPLSKERTDQQEKKTSGAPDAWSTVASQIDVLASGKDANTKPEERSSKRHVSSMFDDPIPESDEFRALKDMMGEQTNQEGKPRAAFLERETDTRQRGRGRRQAPPEEGEGRGRGSRYKPPVEVDDLPETNFEPIEDEMPVSRGRGRRGSKYDGGSRRDRERVQDNVPQEEWSEIDAALQADRDEPMQRGGGRHQRYEKRRRPERTERHAADMDVSDGEDSGVLAVHGNVPSWDEAIGDIITGNIARHKGSSGRGRR